MKRRTGLLAAVTAGILAAVCLTAGILTELFGRLGLIRATMHSALPGWLKTWIWGWR